MSRSPGGEALELGGLVAVVTGSSGGIGRAMALELARGGASVVIHGGRSRSRVEDVRDEVRALGGQAEAVLADLRQRADCERLIELSWAAFGRVDIWINNAGADILTGGRHELSFEEKLRELLLVDVTATMLLGRGAGERMKRSGSGVIVNIGWDQAESGMEGESGELFAAAKAAVMGFTRSLARSLAPAVRVNCIAPGWIRTAWGASASRAWQERVIAETPLGRWGSTEDVARTARFLCSRASEFITGQVICVNGGAVRR